MGSLKPYVLFWQRNLKMMLCIILSMFLFLLAACEQINSKVTNNTMAEIKTISGFAEADGASLYYEYTQHAPESETIFFIHGSTGSSLLWEQQVPEFVDAGFNVVVFDLRSAGNSKAKEGKSSAGTIADDLEAIRRELNLGGIYIVGQALGGEGALEYSIKYQQNTKAIVVVASYRAAEAEPDFVTLRDTLAPPSSFAGRSGLQMRLSGYYLENNQAGVDRFVEIDQQNKARQAVDGKLDQKRLKASVQSAGIALDYAQLANINVPTLILSAERDDVTPPALMSELAKQIPGARYQTVANAGRYSFWENPPEFNKVVIDFFKEINVSQQLNTVAPGKYLAVPDGKIWYRDTGGSGDPVLLLHPQTGTEEVFKHQLIALADRGFRVVAFARRGAGLSGDLPPVDSDASDDIKALLEHLDVQGVHLVGAAAGGVHALNYAIAYPTQVRSLTLSNSLAGITKTEAYQLLSDFIPPALPAHIKELGPSYRYSNSHGVDEWLDIEKQSISKKYKSLPTEKVKAYNKATVNSFKEPAEIRQLNIPVLLVYGGADLFAPPAHGRKIQNRFKHAELIVVPESGHAIHWENPTEFNKVITHFLNGL